MGGKPSRQTPADKRLKANQGKPASAPAHPIFGTAPKPAKGKK